MMAGTRERLLRSLLPLAMAALAAPLSQPVQAQARLEAAGPEAALTREIAERAGKDLRPFYAARQYRPLWLNEFGRPSGAASMLMHHLRTAQFDGVSPRKLR